ncbi:MAG: hypothetical protein KDA22_05370, partial [Phycisphaerales bacterium]|nr:hypothetical protein [Phycisphaerales bacterium]
VWARAGRQWRNDDISPEVPQRGAINNNQRAPRYVFAKRPDSEVVSNTAGIKKMVGQTEDDVVGDVFRKNQDPDLDPFFVSQQSRRKPTYFTTRTVADGSAPDAPPFGYAYPRGFPIRMDADTFAAAHSLKNPAWRIRDADKTPGTTSVYPFPMQMMVKDAPFDQVGELLLVPMWGPVVELDSGSIKTVWTLAEILSGCAPEYPVDNGGNATTDDGIYLNRLRLDARTGDGQAEMTGIDPATGTVPDPRALYRWRLPAGVSLFDAFVCDGPGAWPPRRDAYSNTDGFIVQLDPFNAVPIDIETSSPRNGGGGFAPGLPISSTLATETTPADPTAVRGAEAVRGMININTAPIEVMRALPQFCWMIHPDVVLPDDVLEAGRVRVPEAVVQYRDRLQDPTNYLPSYGDRGIVNGFLPGLRVGRGMASAGELLLLRRSSTQKPLALLGTPDPNVATESSYQIDYAAGDVWGFPRYVWPQRSTTPAADARLSTEVNGPTIIPTLNPRNPVLVGPNGTLFGVGDNVAGDAEEANLLFSGVSNLVTTRSDVFTVYIRVRTFGQNPVTGLWDATDPDQIVEDSRYVMQVDRSDVRSPFDRPRIVFIQKVDG